MDRCQHVNVRGYGQCVLSEGHLPPDNGNGVKYLHSYAKRDDAFGTLDVYESLSTTDRIVSRPDQHDHDRGPAQR